MLDDPNQFLYYTAPDMPDCRQWIADLKTFYARFMAVADDEWEGHLAVGDVCTESELQAVESRLPVEIPESLREFFLTGSSEVRFGIRLNGLSNTGPQKFLQYFGDLESPLFSLKTLLQYLTDCRSNAARTDWPEEFREKYERWTRSVPFLCIDNADFIALDPVPDAFDPYVVYLSHDDADQFLSRNFAAFLTEWPRTGYISLSIHDLQFMIDEATDSLSGDTLTACELREELTRLGIVAE